MAEMIVSGDYISIIELSEMLCVPQTIIVEWIEHDVVSAKIQADSYYVAAYDIARAKSAMRLMRDLGVNSSAISIILSLREKIKELEAVVSVNMR
ncbi:chaperone modulator CbpM [Cysteiniphilum sp. JM-1]|uniref:chaperone modulator CbpM n=1 Tax=Cysteiniphilum TaxID=2056696 RepID=UPI001246D7C9|nr:chaperone modulator CbpM [Cysteiniphilum sp. JM-1]